MDLVRVTDLVSVSDLVTDLVNGLVVAIGVIDLEYVGDIL